MKAHHSADRNPVGGEEGATDGGNGGFGGGDVKLVIALGAALGPLALLSALFWVALSGGLLALIAVIRGRRDLAYVPAIAMGLLVYFVRLEFWHHASVL